MLQASYAVYVPCAEVQDVYMPVPATDVLYIRWRGQGGALTRHPIHLN